MAEQDARSQKVAGLVLAAGKGTRMRSALPKVLHPVAGRPMLAWVLRALATAEVGAVCAVLSEESADFHALLRDHPDLRLAIQSNRQGTGDAVAAAAWSFAGVAPAPFAAGRALRGAPIQSDYVLIMAGDVPAVRGESLRDFIAAVDNAQADFGVLGMRVPEPHGYGRLVMAPGGGSALEAIVEEKDADTSTRKLDFCNTGIMLARTPLLFELLHELRPQNVQNEYYLTDCVHLARARRLRVVAHAAAAWQEFAGINDQVQRAQVEAWMVERKREALMRSGVQLCLPSTIYVEPDVEVGQDARVGSGCQLLGATRIGAGCVIGANSYLANVTLPAGADVPPLSVRIN